MIPAVRCGFGRMPERAASDGCSVIKMHTGPKLRTRGQSLPRSDVLPRARTHGTRRPWLVLPNGVRTAIRWAMRPRVVCGRHANVASKSHADAAGGYGRRPFEQTECQKSATHHRLRARSRVHKSAPEKDESDANQDASHSLDSFASPRHLSDSVPLDPVTNGILPSSCPCRAEN